MGRNMANVLEQELSNVSSFGKFFRFCLDKRMVRHLNPSDALGVDSPTLLGSCQSCWPK